jgi:hypothetical protein
VCVDLVRRISGVLVCVCRSSQENLRRASVCVCVDLVRRISDVLVYV